MTKLGWKMNQFAWAGRKSLYRVSHALSTSLALIDLRLRNCALIKERLCFRSFLPFYSDFIYLVLTWTQLGPMCRSFAALCAPPVRLAIVYFPSNASFCVHGEIWEVVVARRGEIQHVTDGRWNGPDKLRQSLKSYPMQIDERLVIRFKIRSFSFYKDVFTNTEEPSLAVRPTLLY